MAPPCPCFYRGLEQSQKRTHRKTDCPASKSLWNDMPRDQGVSEALPSTEARCGKPSQGLFEDRCNQVGLVRVRNQEIVYGRTPQVRCCFCMYTLKRKRVGTMKLLCSGLTFPVKGEQATVKTCFFGRRDLLTYTNVPLKEATTLLSSDLFVLYDRSSHTLQASCSFCCLKLSPSLITLLFQTLVLPFCRS